MQESLLSIYNKLYKTFGPQYWWPGETPFEITVGAILTQNTNWQNVEKAIKNIKKNNCLTPLKIKTIPVKKLAELIRPAGYYNIKAHRLKQFIKFLYDEYKGKISSMAKEDTAVLRNKLLNVHGIGHETADSILLYALNKPIFVVDAYTKRIFSRHELLRETSAYHETQELFMKNLPRNVKLFNEFHALIVKLGKEYCKTKQKCDKCPLGKEVSWNWLL